VENSARKTLPERPQRSHWKFNTKYTSISKKQFMRIAPLLVEIVKLFGGAVRRIRIQALHHVGPAPLAAAQGGQRVRLPLLRTLRRPE